MRNNIEIILASGSPRRREIIKNMGYELQVIPSNVDEDTDETRPDKLVEELSSRKCLDIAEKVINKKIHPSIDNDKRYIVIGADTVVALGNKILGKPADHVIAVEMISDLQGKAHQVYTGVTITVMSNDLTSIEKKETFSERTDVYVAEMETDEILDYVDSKEPFDKAGGYGIQGKFGKFIKKIDGDYYNVVGLPSAELYVRLKKI